MTLILRRVYPLLLLTLLMGVWGCPNNAPEAAFPHVLTLGSRSLPPIPSRSYDRRILEGTAQVLGLEDRAAIPTAPELEEPVPTDTPADAAADGVKAIETMVAEYNLAAREKRKDDVVEFIHPKDQPLVKAFKPFGEAMENLTEAMEAKQAGSSKAMMGPMAGQMEAITGEITVTDITLTGENTATGSMTVTGLAMPSIVTFEKVEGEWYMSGGIFQGLELEKVKPALDEATKEIQLLSAGVKDGTVPVAMVAPRFLQAMMKLGPIFAEAMSSRQAKPIPPPN